MNTDKPKPPAAKEVWESFVKANWTREQDIRIGRLYATVSNSKQHLADNLTFKGYANGTYTLACRDKHFTAWARVKLVQLGEQLRIHAKAYFEIDRPVSVEFVTRESTEKF